MSKIVSGVVISFLIGSALTLISLAYSSKGEALSCSRYTPGADNVAFYRHLRGLPLAYYLEAMPADCVRADSRVTAGNFPPENNHAKIIRFGLAGDVLIWSTLSLILISTKRIKL